MLIILSGNDTGKRSKRLAAILAPIQKEKGDIQTYTDVSFDVAHFRMLAESTSLFGGTSTIVLSGVGDIPDAREELEKILPVLVKSPHRFIVSEQSLLAPFLKKAESKGATVEKFELAAKEKKSEAFNSFLLTDAFSDRKRSLTWALYRKAIGLGVEPRELAGKLFWVTKNMLLAGHTANASEAGMNPFVYTKAKAGSARFAGGELEKIAFELTILFHESMLSGVEFEPALEAFILRALVK